MNPNLKYIYFFFGGWGRLAEGAGVIEFFFTKNQNLKKIFFSFYIFIFVWGGGRFGGVGVGGRGGRWMDSRTGPNQFAPSISSKLGA